MYVGYVFSEWYIYRFVYFEFQRRSLAVISFVAMARGEGGAVDFGEGEEGRVGCAVVRKGNDSFEGVCLNTLILRLICFLL
jgi:hypothetical protein